MKRIGLLGGMSFESSIEYERLINERVRATLGGAASADLIIRSYNFAQIETLQEQGRWADAGSLLATDAVMMQTAGAELIALCTNTMHKVAPEIESAIDVPFVHIVDATADAIAEAGVASVGLLGTRYTMEDPFYSDRLAMHGIATLVPDEPDRTVVHDIIFDELVQGVVAEDSKHAYVGAIDRLENRGALGIVAGCTEIELLVQAEDIGLPYFASTALHVDAIVREALA
ncbi:MAG: aspartate/glutamate racemase family protein [Acidimicrobiia bacterium]